METIKIVVWMFLLIIVWSFIVAALLLSLLITLFSDRA